MAQHTEDDRSLAAHILNALFRSTEERSVPSIEEEFGEVPHGFSIWDVQHDVNSFADELFVLKYFNNDSPHKPQFPALTFGRDLTLPVSLSFLGLPGFSALPLYRYSLRRSHWRDLLYALLDDLAGSWSENLSHHIRLTSLEFGQAQESFLQNATTFLANRIAAVRDFNSGERNPPELVISPTLPPRIGAPPAPTIGCNFIVTTNTSSLRVFWSGAYYVSPNFFAAPTTPASGVLQTGTYVFGVDGGLYGNTVQWDKNAVCRLPGVPKVHLNF